MIVSKTFGETIATSIPSPISQLQCCYCSLSCSLISKKKIDTCQQANMSIYVVLIPYRVVKHVMWNWVLPPIHRWHRIGRSIPTINTAARACHSLGRAYITLKEIITLSMRSIGEWWTHLVAMSASLQRGQTKGTTCPDVRPRELPTQSQQRELKLQGIKFKARAYYYYIIWSIGGLAQNKRIVAHKNRDLHLTFKPGFKI